MTRISKDEYYIGVAIEISMRSTCLRRHYGAVIVKDDVIMSTGYNGAPRGDANCCDIGKCTREELKIPSGERYELCRSVHAEQNAIIQAGYERTRNSTLYLAGMDARGQIKNPRPCNMCWRFIKNAGIIRVVVPSDNGTEVIYESDKEDKYEAN